MTDDRKEPTISPLKPEQDEIIRHRQRTNGNKTGGPGGGGGAGGGSGGGGAGNGGGGSPRTGGSAARPVVVRSKLAPFALLVALTGLGLAGFAYWQLMEAQKRADAAVARIADLEQRLEVTGDESEQSLAALQAKLKWADSEIRKLWGVAYDTNRKAIAENTSSVASISQQVKKLDGQLSTVASELRTELRNTSERLAERINNQETSLQEIEKTRLQLQKQSQQLNDTLRQLRETQSTLENRVKTNEQAIEAIDTFRRSVNRDLLELKSGGSSPQ